MRSRIVYLVVALGALFVSGLPPSASRNLTRAEVRRAVYPPVSEPWRLAATSSFRTRSANCLPYLSIGIWTLPEPGCRRGGQGNKGHGC